MRRTILLLVPLIVMAASPATAAPPVPQTIELTSPGTVDSGFQAEGIVARGSTAYAGSLATGEVVAANLITGQVTPLVDPAGGPAVGLALDGHRLWVAGGPTGEARVYDVRTGEPVAVVQLAPAGTAFINDVAVVGGVAYVTDSFNAVLYRVPTGPGGAVGPPQALALTGDFELVPGAFNSNGIVGTGGGAATRLILAQSTDPDPASSASALYVVEPSPSGGEAVATEIDLGGDQVGNADGLVLRGRTLYVVENARNRIAVVRLSGDLQSGDVVRRLTDDDFATPTTATFALGRLYAVNARFADLAGGADPATLPFEIVRVGDR